MIVPGTKMFDVEMTEPCKICGVRQDTAMAVVTEADGLGYETEFFCDEHKEQGNEISHQLSASDPEDSCEWCLGHEAVKNFRDPEEGNCGPVYRVCRPCRLAAYEH